jgi:hypothetical protein
MLNVIFRALQTFPDYLAMTLWEQDFEREATLLLAGKLFHVTAAHNVPSIIASGAIQPNIGGRFRRSFSGSRKSYGAKLGYVSMFDFRSADEIAMHSAFWKYISGRLNSWARRLTFLTIDDSLDVIPWEVAHRDTDGKGFYIPEVECWSATPIPIRLVTRAIYMHVPLSEWDVIARRMERPHKASMRQHLAEPLNDDSD